MNKDKDQQNNGKQQLVVASARNLRIAPRKLRLMADLVRGKGVEQALLQLKFAPNKGAAMVAKLIQSAVANAKNNHQMEDKALRINEIFVDGAQVMKRSQPRARGSAFLVRHRLSHLTVKLVESGGRQKAVSRKQKAADRKEKTGVVRVPHSASLPETKINRTKGKAVKAGATEEQMKAKKAMAAKRPDDGKGEK